LSEVIIYRGEVAPRKLWIAVLLSLLMPGLGHLYAGQPNRGLSAYLLWLGLFTVIITMTFVAEVFFFRSLVAMIVFYLYLEAWLISDLNRIIRRYGTPYILQNFNHFLVYGCAIFALVILPSLVLYEYTTQKLVGNHTVEDVSMYPMLVPGDRVLFERFGNPEEPIRRGDLVVVETKHHGQHILRVAGLPKDTIYVENDGAVVVNGKSLHQQALGLVAWSDQSIQIAEQPNLRGYLEYGEHLNYPVFYNPSIRLLQTDRVRLQDDNYFLLSDNRTEQQAIDSRNLGAFHVDQIVGRPLYVWYSSIPGHQEVRIRRLGLPLR
jgi:signal peptidase I